MNIYFCGIGGAGLGPLAELAQDAGHTVQGSDPTESLITKQLAERDITVDTNQDGQFLQNVHDSSPLDWFVFSSGIPDDHPEITMAKQLGIKVTKRDELIEHILQEKNLKLFAIAGTHGKTRTVGLTIWIMQQLGIPVSYSIGTTLPFGPSGKYQEGSEYFVYECDEFDRNFLAFHPHLSIVTTIDYDHPDTYESPDDYVEAFRQFLTQSEHSVLWQNDAGSMAELTNSWALGDDEVNSDLQIPGVYNRRNATLVVKAFEKLGLGGDIINAVNSYPGVDRRFEMLVPNLYTDYGHHPAEIKATLQLASELNRDIVLVYQPHQNLRQHQIKQQYADCLVGAKDVYWLPTFLTREDNNIPVLTPQELTENVINHEAVHIAEMNDELWVNIQKARDRGALVLVMGAGSIDGWVREMLALRHTVGTILFDKNNNFLLQDRDDIPDIRQPGKLAMFGGAVELSDSSLRNAAVRELHEETNIQFAPDALTCLIIAFDIDDQGKRVLRAVYMMTNVDTDGLEIYEGRGYMQIQPDELDKFPVAPSTLWAIKEYLRQSSENDKD